MRKLTFQVDDPELLDFVYSLGRKRSEIICLLLRACMDEGGGYVPLRIMAATGFSYKGKKIVKRSSADQKQSVPERKSHNKEETHTKVPQKAEENENKQTNYEPETVAEPEQKEVTTGAAETAHEENNEPEQTYVSKAPKIENPELLKGLSAFGM